VPSIQLSENVNTNPTKTIILPCAFYILISNKKWRI